MSMLIDTLQLVSCCHFYLGTPQCFEGRTRSSLFVSSIPISTRAGSSIEAVRLLRSFIALTWYVFPTSSLNWNQSAYTPFWYFPDSVLWFCHFDGSRIRCHVFDFCSFRSETTFIVPPFDRDSVRCLKRDCWWKWACCEDNEWSWFWCWVWTDILTAFWSTNVPFKASQHLEVI